MMADRRNGDKTSQVKPDSKPKDIVLAGAFAAFTVDLLIYPLDTIKTRIQSKEYKKVYAGKANRAALWRGLYQGVGSVVIATLPSSAAFFTTYEFSKSLFNITSLPEPAVHSISSSIAELVSCAILTPAEVLKQQAQTLRNAPHSHNQHVGGRKPILAGVAAESTSLQAFSKFRNNPMDLFRGYFALVGRNLPFTALQFPLYEHLKKWFGRGMNLNDDISKVIQVNAMAAGVAGTVAAVLTTPVDVIKTRVMLAASQNRRGDMGDKTIIDANISKQTGKAAPGVYRAVVTEILKEEGFKGLWRGVGLRGLWSGLGLAVYLSAYESGKVYLRRRERHLEEL